MKITGYLGQGGLGYVRPVILCTNPSFQSPIRMVVDTGASRTTISERDAIRLGLDYGSLICPSDGGRVLGVGGTCRCYLIEGATLIFKVTSNSWHAEYLDVISAS